MTMKVVGVTLTMVLALTISSTVLALPITILDSYYGADDHGYGDVIGNAGKFDISKAVVSVSGGAMFIDIYSRYLDNVGELGTGLGDLFISTDGWSPFGSSPYLHDNASNGESWEWGLSLDSYAKTATSGDLLFYGGTPATLLSQDLTSSGIFRNGQEVRVKRSASTLAGIFGSWAIDKQGTSSDMDDFLRFTINNYSSVFGGATNFGLHWGMSCANDVIEGGFVVPEPSTVILLGLGLLGVGIADRRRRKNA